MLNIRKKLFWLFNLLVIIFAISCSGADLTKPEDMNVDLGKELGSGRFVTDKLTTTITNGSAYVFVAGTNSTDFLGSLIKLPSMSNYRSGNGAGIQVTDILKVNDISSTNSTVIDITGGVTVIKNDAGGVYRIDIPSTVTNIEVEYSYKLKAITTSTQAPKIEPTIKKVNNDATNWTSLDLYNEIAGSSESSLFGKTYIIGTAASVSANPTTYYMGLITNNILTNNNVSVSSNGGAYKLWIY